MCVENGLNQVTRTTDIEVGVGKGYGGHIVQGIGISKTAIFEKNDALPSRFNQNMRSDTGHIEAAGRPAGRPTKCVSSKNEDFNCELEKNRDSRG